MAGHDLSRYRIMASYVLTLDNDKVISGKHETSQLCHNNVIFLSYLVLVLVGTPKNVTVKKQCDVAKWHRKTSNSQSLLHSGWVRL